MPDLNELLMLIRLLKAEGVKEYSNNGCFLSFYSVESPNAGICGGLDDQQVQREAENSSATDATPSEAIAPPIMGRLNPNYAKLTGYRNG